MGRNVAAYLAYGVSLSYEQIEQLPWDPGADEDEYDEESPKPAFEDWAATDAGLVSPYPHTGAEEQEGVWSAWYEIPENKRAMSEYWSKKRELVESLPVQEIVHNKVDYELVIAVLGTISVAHWATPEKPKMEIDEVSLYAATEFCNQRDIPFLNPDWILFAYSDSNR